MELLLNLIRISLDSIAVIITLIISSFAIRQAVIYVGQNWIKTFSHTLTLFMLPIVTYTITSVISNNIALSLGMIGALSIVRFRNPVKSPFELVIYFVMITAGIAGSVSLNWLLLLTVTTVLILFASQLLNKIFLYLKGRPIFVTSFTEGNSLHSLEVTCTVELEELSQRNELISFSKSENIIIYRLASHDRNVIMYLAKMLENNVNVSHIVFNAA